MTLRARRAWVLRLDAEWRWQRALRQLLSVHGSIEREAAHGDDRMRGNSIGNSKPSTFRRTMGYSVDSPVTGTLPDFW